MKRSIKVPAVFAAGLLAIACASSSVSAQVTGSQAKLFLSNGSVVAVYAIDNQKPGNPIATIATSGAQGLATDGAGRLYVAQQGRGDVAIFSTRSLRQVGLLHDPGQQPSSIAIGRNGTVYVGNMFSAPGGAGSVSIYEHGSVFPTKRLTCSTFYQVEGVAVNSRGQVFVNQNRANGSNPEVDTFEPGSKACHALSVSEYTAGGAIVDPATGDLLLADSGYSVILILAPPYTSVTGHIYMPVCRGERAFNLALDSASSLLYVANPTTGHGADVLAYPGGGLIGTYAMADAYGIALSR